jgi:hypothetical protein
MSKDYIYTRYIQSRYSNAGWLFSRALNTYPVMAVARCRLEFMRSSRAVRSSMLVA